MYTKIASHMVTVCFILCFILSINQIFPNDSNFSFYLFLFVMIASVVSFYNWLYKGFFNLFDVYIESTKNELAIWIDKSSPKKIIVSIFMLSAGSLFLELILIRWQASLFPIFALYKNFTLLACFLGLGLGYALAASKQPILLPFTLPMVVLNLLFCTIVKYGSNHEMQMKLEIIPIREEFVVGMSKMLNSDIIGIIISEAPIYLLLTFTFIINVLVMLPLSQFCGRFMQKVEPLKSYSLNLLGSLAGIGTIFLLSSLWIGPVIWFGLITAGILYYQLSSYKARQTGLACGVAALLITAWPIQPFVENIYSPYQFIQKIPATNGLTEILTGGMFYQKMFDLSFTNVKNNPSLKRMASIYELPFQVANSLDRVAIVGAGSGNDVAAALRYKSQKIDAIEIDPVIRDLGIIYHSEHPYHSAHVNSIINDARTFFRNTENFYDLIVYSFLDSHILLSHGSNVRVDSFVYTQEGLQEAYRQLKPGGVLSLSFLLSNQNMGKKIYFMLKNLPGAGRPVVFLTEPNSLSAIFLVRKNAELTLSKEFLLAHAPLHLTDSFVTTVQESLDLPTDDWPFFYMDKKIFPTSYAVLMTLMVSLSVYLIHAFLPLKKIEHSLLPFFFLGAGFMLVETKTITEFGLLFGNTWQVVGTAIIGALLMGYLANLMVMRVHFRTTLFFYLSLIGTLILGYIIAVNGEYLNNVTIEKPLKLLLLTLPFIFSGAIFSTLLKDVKELPDAMAYNLIGSIVGGFLEYNAMQFGFSSLYLIALILYSCAWFFSYKKSVKF